MELVNTWTLQKKPNPKPRISAKLTCLIASRVLNRAEQNFTDTLELHVAVWTCCRATGTCPSFQGHTSEPVTEGSAWTVTSGPPRTQDYTLLGSPRYSPAITALAGCSVGSRGAPGTPLLLTGLGEVGTPLGSGSSLTPSHPPPAGEERACFILQGSWVLGDHSGGWGLMLPVTSLEFQTTRELGGPGAPVVWGVEVLPREECGWGRVSGTVHTGHHLPVSTAAGDQKMCSRRTG